MEIFNTAMPAAARQAFEQAHRQRAGTVHNRTRPQQTGKRDLRLTTAHQQYLADERGYRERNKGRRDEVRAIAAKTVLRTQRTPKLTARRLQIAQVKAAADKARIQQARTPERIRARQQREMNTKCFQILKGRGIV